MADRYFCGGPGPRQNLIFLMKLWIWVIVLMVFIGLGGCRSGGWLSKIPLVGNNERAVTQTKGGTIDMTILTPEGEEIHVELEQPSNADAPANLVYVWPDGSKWIEVTTGSSRADESAEIWANAGQYDLFIYIGAGVFALGLVVLICSFWFPLIPKTAGILMMAGGGLTAYMTTALEDYGWVFLVGALLGAWHWWTHRRTAKRDPIEFDLQKQREIKLKATELLRHETAN